MKNKRIFGKRDFLKFFQEVLDRFDVQESGVFLAEVDTTGLKEIEAAALCDDPEGSLENPVLPFPFSYTDAERFTDNYGLWGLAHMERLLLASGEVLTLEKTSEELEMDPHGTFAVMQPQNDPTTHELLPVLQPSVFFDNIVLDWRGKDGREKRGTLHGLFDLCNYRGLQADSRGVIRVLFLERGGIFYAVPEDVKKIVNISRVYVTRNILREYLKGIGKDTPDMLAEAETEEAVAPLAGGEQPETPAAGLNEGKQGRSDEAQPLPPSEALRSKQRRYCTPQEKREAKKTILPRIHKKIDAGVKWHHCTEVDRYMTEKGILGDKRSGLIGAVKKALRENEITLPTGKPLKS